MGGIEFWLPVVALAVSLWSLWFGWWVRYQHRHQERLFAKRQERRKGHRKYR